MYRRGNNNAAPAGSCLCRIRLVLIAMTAFSAGMLFFTGCDGEAKSKVPRPKAVPVTVTTAVEKDVPETLATIGSVEPSNTVSIRARIGGALTKVSFREGQDVRQGDLLFAIDPRPYQAALQAALGALARDRAQLANAEATARRYTQLLNDEYVTKQQYDQAVTNTEALKGTVSADEAAVATARLNLQYCSILAPISGRTGNLMVHEGDQIKADDIPMVVINRITPIKVSFSLPEQNLTDIRRYAAAGSLLVEVSLPNDPAKPLRGTLAFIQNTVDVSTGTILLKAAFPNADRRLWPGQFVNVSLTLATRHSVVIPAQAVQTGQEGPFVYVVNPDLTVASRLVLPGREMEGEVVVIKGLQAGETVVRDGQLRLLPGAKVKIQPDGKTGDRAS